MTTPGREWTGNQFDRVERFVVLQLESISLIVSQAEIVALEPVLDVQSASPSDASIYVEQIETPHVNAAGYLLLSSGPCAVFSLDTDLQCLAGIPATHRICAVMRNRQESYALSCVAVSLLSKTEVSFHATPRAMLNVRSPVMQLLVNDGKLLLGTTAATLYAHLSMRSEGDVISFEQRRRMKA
jgi:hypothetical protein